MASFMHMPFLLVFIKINCISAFKCILLYYFHACILEFVYVHVWSLSLHCFPKPHAFPVELKTLYTTNYHKFIIYTLLCEQLILM